MLMFLFRISNRSILSYQLSCASSLRHHTCIVILAFGIIFILEVFLGVEPDAISLILTIFYRHHRIQFLHLLVSFCSR